MNTLGLARAFAYEQLGRWLPKFQKEYARTPYAADYMLVQMLNDRQGDARFITPEELLGASILDCVMTIETTLEVEAEEPEMEEETEEPDADNALFLDRLKTELHQNLMALGKLTGREFPYADSPLTTSHIEIEGIEAPMKRREQQYEIILAVIAAFNFDPLNVPYGGKAKIEEVCRMRPLLHSKDSFRGAWKDGSKRGLFKWGGMADS